MTPSSPLGVLAGFLTIAGVFPSAGVAQPTRQVAEGVYVVVAGSRNVGWVDLGADILAVVTGDTQLALRSIRAAATKPIRVAFSPNGSDAPPGAGGGDVELIPRGRSEARRGVRFDRMVSLGPRLVEVRELTRAVSPGNGIVYVPDVGVLFAGDLVGEGSVIGSSRTDDWITVLTQLERLGPRHVVPGQGPVGGPELLRRTREELVAARAHARQGVDRRLSIDEIAASSPTPALARHVAREMVGLVPPAMIDDLELRAGPSFSAKTAGWTPPRIVVIADLWPSKPGRIAELGYVAPGIEIRIPTEAAQLAPMMADADALLGVPTAAAFRGASRLRWIQSPSAGVEGPLAIPGLAVSPVVLTNAQRIYGPPLAEHVFGLLLGLTRKLQVAVPLMRASEWADDPDIFPPAQMPELRGKTMLIAGLGGIGTEVAAAAHGMGMRVIATRNNKSRPTDLIEYVGGAGELAALAAEADVVVNALPLTPATRNVFSAEVFGAMKRTTYFINIGRGGTVDTEALTVALESNRLGGAGLDVVNPEPLPASHRLWGLPNVIITPHVGSSSDLERERTWLLFRENLRRFVAGEPLLSVVDKKAAY